MAYQGNISEFTCKVLGSCTDSFNHEKRCMVDVQAEKTTNDYFIALRLLKESEEFSEVS